MKVIIDYAYIPKAHMDLRNDTVNRILAVALERKQAAAKAAAKAAAQPGQGKTA